MPDLGDLAVALRGQALTIAGQLLGELGDLLGALRLAQGVLVEDLALGRLCLVDLRTSASAALSLSVSGRASAPVSFSWRRSRSMASS